MAKIKQKGLLLCHCKTKKRIGISTGDVVSADNCFCRADGKGRGINYKTVLVN